MNYIPRAKRYRADETAAQWQVAKTVWLSVVREDMTVSDWRDARFLEWDAINNMVRACNLRMFFSDKRGQLHTADGRDISPAALYRFVPRSTFAEMYRWVEAEKLTVETAAQELARLVNITDGTCASRSTLQRELQAHYGGGSDVCTPAEAVNALRRALLRLAAIPDAVPAALKAVWPQIVKWLDSK